MPLAGQAKPRASLLAPTAQQKASQGVKNVTKFGDNDESTTSESDSDEEQEAALEMDGQELWTQNYCSVCDCLIEPGTGVGTRRQAGALDEGDLVQPSSSTTAPLIGNGLRSVAGTIKGRPTSSEGKSGSNTQPAAPLKQAKTTATTSTNEPLKRTSSAGRIHAVGGPSTTSGLHRRTGSTGSRLNALSELRPTTKLHEKGKQPVASRAATAKGHGRKDGSNTENATRSPERPRPNSGVSQRSGQSQGSTSGASSPVNPQLSPLPRSRKGGLLLGQLKLEEEAANTRENAAPALYCSERCRAIDERRSQSVGDMGQYFTQPPVSPSQGTWASGTPITAGFPRRIPSMTSMPAGSLAYASYSALMTPESECLCPECLERSSAGGTIPSGASDTTESSVSGGYFARQKHRTYSGRAVPTMLPATASQRESQSAIVAATSRVAPTSRPASVQAPGRTTSAASSGERSNGTTDGTRSSSDSEPSGSLWEPSMRCRVTTDRQGAESGGRHRRSSYQGVADRRDIQLGSTEGRTRSSTVSDETYAVNTAGTVTPAAKQTGDSVVSALAPALDVHIASSAASASPADARGSGPLSQSAISVNGYSHASPLKLLKRGERHSAAAHTDVSLHQSESYSTSLTSHSTSVPAARSLVNTYERAELEAGGASNITLVGSSARGATLLERRQTQGRGVPSLILRDEEAALHGPHHRASSPLAQSSARRDDGSATGGGSALASKGSRQSRRSSEVSTERRSALGSLLTAQSKDGRKSTLRMANSGSDAHGAALDAASAAAATTDDSHGRRSSSLGGGLFRSLSNAVSTILGYPAQPSSSSAASNPRALNSVRHGSSGGADGIAIRPRPRPQSEVRTSAASSLTALSALDAKSRGEHVTPTQSLIAKPSFRRGSVPAYASEIGRGQIPGDRGPPVSPVQTKVDAVSPQPSAPNREVLSAEEEERRRRRAERERALRHQRSKEVTILPPLLPSTRTLSNTNLAGMPSRWARSHSNSSGGGGTGHLRGRTGSSGHLVIGSAGSMSGPSRVVTPALRRSPNSQTRATPAGDQALSRSNPSSLGSSPRRPGLGWGAMTKLSPSASMEPSGGASQPIYSSSISGGHASRGQLVPQNVSSGYTPQHHVHHHHNHGHHSRGHRHVASHGIHSTRLNAGAQLGHFGLLGHHPHGHTSAYGRHATTPVRSSTPRVPEDGGEMSSEALMGLPSTDNPMPATSSRRHMPPPPVRPRSVMAMRASGWPHPIVSSPMTPLNAPAPVVQEPAHQRTWSYDALPGLGQKTYPVLQLPGRETHDHYDAGWGLERGGLEEILTGQKTSTVPAAAKSDAAQTNQPVTSVTASPLAAQPPAPTPRKKLFYFDAN